MTLGPQVKHFIKIQPNLQPLRRVSVVPSATQIKSSSVSFHLVPAQLSARAGIGKHPLIKRVPKLVDKRTDRKVTNRACYERLLNSLQPLPDTNVKSAKIPTGLTKENEE